MIKAEKALELVLPVYAPTLDKIEKEIVRAAKNGYTRCSYSDIGINFDQMSAIADIMEGYGYSATASTSGLTSVLSIAWHGTAKKGKRDSVAQADENRDSDDGFGDGF